MKLRSHKGFIKAVCILNAVALQFNTFADWWDYAKQVASEQWEETKQAASVQWEETKQAASEKWEETKQAASVKWEETKQAASEKWEETKQVTSRKWDKTKQAASEKWKEAKRAASEKWNETKQVTSKKWDKTKQAASEKWDETKQVTSNKWGETKQWCSANKETIITTIAAVVAVAIAIYRGQDVGSTSSSYDSSRASGYTDRDSRSTKEALIYKDAGLVKAKINGRPCLIKPNIDMDTRTDVFGRTNRQRMSAGLAPLDESGKPIELHHIGQHPDSPLAELTQEQHRGKDNYSVLHDTKKESEINRQAFDGERVDHWKTRAK